MKRYRYSSIRLLRVMGPRVCSVSARERKCRIGFATVKYSRSVSGCSLASVPRWSKNSTIGGMLSGLKVAATHRLSTSLGNVASRC